MELEILYIELDEKHYEGKLRAAGWRVQYAKFPAHLFDQAMPTTRTIQLVQHLNNPGNPELRRTLLHEMIHAWLSLTNDPSHRGRNETHGASFSAELKRLILVGKGVAGEEKYVVCSDTSKENLHAVAKIYLARRSGKESPSGKRKDGRWFSDEKESQSCCSQIRSPTRSWPDSLLKHCKSMHHISRLHGVDTVALIATIKEIDQNQTQKESSRLIEVTHFK